MADQRGSIGPSVLQLPRDRPENLLYGGGGAPPNGVPHLVLPHHQGVGGLDEPGGAGPPDTVELSLQDFQSSGEVGTNSGSDDDDSSPRGDSAGGGPEENDTRRARRILANRRSAQRSRTRRMQYIHEIERKVGWRAWVDAGKGVSHRGWRRCLPNGDGCGGMLLLVPVENRLGLFVPQFEVNDIVPQFVCWFRSAKGDVLFSLANTRTPGACQLLRCPVHSLSAVHERLPGGRGRRQRLKR